jgi:hypothetical protein
VAIVSKVQPILGACCGKPRRGKFCPDCGKAVTPPGPPSPIHELLGHLAQRATVAGKVAETKKRYADRVAYGHTRNHAADKDTADALETAKKWQRWLLALQQLMDEAAR